jgi:hypothetical protein
VATAKIVNADCVGLDVRRREKFRSVLDEEALGRKDELVRGIQWSVKDEDQDVVVDSDGSMATQNVQSGVVNRA